MSNMLTNKKSVLKLILLQLETEASKLKITNLKWPKQLMKYFICMI